MGTVLKYAVSVVFYRRLWLQLAIVSLLLLPTTGCQAVILLGYLIGGPPSIEPDFEKQTSKTLAKKGVRVLVLCYAPNDLKWDNDAVDYELAKHVAYRLNSHEIKVIDPDRVHAWLDQNDEWDNPDELGAVFKVDYVVYIDMKEYSLFEENSSQLYRGRADAIVTVIEMEKRDKKDKDKEKDKDDWGKRRGYPIYSKEIASRFPTNMPVSVDQMSYADFKKLYLSALSDEVGTLFYESYAGDKIPNSAL